MPPPSSPSADDTQDDSGFHSGGNYFHRRRVFARYVHNAGDNNVTKQHLRAIRLYKYKILYSTKNTLEITQVAAVNSANRNLRLEMLLKREIDFNRFF
jgi:hypothetical protein